MVADVAPQTQQAWNLAANRGNVGQDASERRDRPATSARMAQTPQSCTAGQLSQHQSSAVHESVHAERDQRDAADHAAEPRRCQQNQQRQRRPTRANAFGGSRQGIQQGVTQAQGAPEHGARWRQQLNQANFIRRRARRRPTSRPLNLAALPEPISAEQAKINSDIQARPGLAATGTEWARQNAANYAMLTSAGAQQQQQAQNQINANMAKFNQAWHYPQRSLGMMESALGMTPYDTASAGTSSSQTQTQDSPNFANLAATGLQTLGSLFASTGSDKRIKKNITHLGKDPVTGVPVKAFNFKGQKPGAPKTIGPLAQDIEKRAPGSTMKIGGIMAVPKGLLAAATPSVAHLPSHAANQTIADFMPPSSPGIGPLPPSSPGVAKGISTFAPRPSHVSPRGGARGVHGALANTKARPRVVGGLGG